MKIAEINKKSKIILPKEKGIWTKFVQLYIQGTPYLRSGNIGEFHKDILDKTLMEFDLTICNRDSYKNVGMGEIKNGGDVLYIWGRNESYSMSYNKEHLEKIFDCIPKELNVKFLSE